MDYKSIMRSLKSLFGDHSMKPLTITDLAETVLDGTAMEFRYLMDLANKIESLEAKIDQPKLFFEIFAFYQFIMLATVAAKFNVHGKDLNLFGGDLNEACSDLAKGKWNGLQNLIDSTIASPDFHSIVGRYFREDISLSGLSAEDFDLFGMFLVTDEKHRGGMMTAYLLAYTRILRTGITEDDQAQEYISLLTNSFSMLGWISHLESTFAFTKVLSEQLERFHYKREDTSRPMKPFTE